jgi:hypothetical protein
MPSDGKSSHSLWPGELKKRYWTDAHEKKYHKALIYWLL